MAMRPADFYRLLYSELVLILEGYRARRKREAQARHEESAWMISWLLLPHKKEDSDPITPDQILGRAARRKPAPKFAGAGDAAQAFFAAREAKLKQKRLSDGQ